jgi:chromosome segregation ATPase
MKRILICIFCLFISTTTRAQSPTDSQTLQALLSEVRQLRQDLQTTTAAAQRAQILLYRLQAQQSVVKRLQERVDDTRSKLAQIQSEQKMRTVTIKQFEDRRNSDTPSNEQKDLEVTLANIKARFEAVTNNEQEFQAQLIDAESQLRVEQAKLGGLEDNLDRLEKTLENVKPSSR